MTSKVGLVQKKVAWGGEKRIVLEWSGEEEDYYYRLHCH